jgi:hypothetical protein
VRSPRRKRQIKAAEQGTREKSASAPGVGAISLKPKQIDGPVKGDAGQFGV